MMNRLVGIDQISPSLLVIHRQVTRRCTATPVCHSQWTDERAPTGRSPVAWRFLR
jgi:hypothetical protein